MSRDGGKPGLWTPQVELMHEDPAGDVYATYFRLPKGAADRHVEKCFQEVGQKFIEAMGKDGWEVNGKSVRCFGPFTEPGIIERLDEDLYYIVARFRRRKPLIITIEQAELMEATPRVRHPGRDFFKFIQWFSNLSDSEKEQEARQRRGLAEQAERQRELEQELQQLRRQHGIDS